MALEVDPRTLLDKLAFGSSNSELTVVIRKGAEAWLAEQLHPPKDDDCQARIAATELRLKYSSKTPATEVDEERRLEVIGQPIDHLWKTLDKEVPNQERSFLRTAVAMATLIRAVHSHWQLREERLLR